MTSNRKSNDVADVAEVSYDRLYPRAKLVLPEWEISDAGGVPCMFYWRGRPLGSRTLWLARYSTPAGWVTPEDFLPLGKATRLQLQLEAEDAIGSGQGDARKLAIAYVALVNDDHNAEAGMRKLLAELRGQAPESIAWWLPRGEKVRFKTYRRGWAPAGFSGKTV
jgi:hypothetical protein